MSKTATSFWTFMTAGPACRPDESLIWQRFERGAHRLIAATPGLGIGLAIVRAVTESHGGTAHYRESERLGGACFALAIPGCVEAAATQEREVSYST